ncbi:histone acetyltransferase 1 [Diaporthe australafricana]|uniref:Histone acetyltransferase type B catalytic subunit n=1 Tax=Diaporthe australafricana TaxID=127596 RepID=A0ABR3W8I5_9PEZI
MADNDEWTTKANDVFSISLVTKSDQGPPKTIDSFQPKWTYPIYEEEEIYGYRGLKINLRFNASDMRPHFSYSKGKEVPANVADKEPTEIKESIEQFLPEVAFAPKTDFEKFVQSTPDDWKPPGALLSTYESKGETYEIWKGSLADPAVLQLVKRIQILVSLFIEGGTPLHTESTEEYEQDPLERWTVFFLYQKRPVQSKPGQFSYIFAGYSTVYRLYALQPQNAATALSTGEFELPAQKDFTEFPCRSRISQFIILPTFGKKGNGMRLYNQVYQTLLVDEKTFEITVEDPNEDFDVVRDMVDLSFLRDQTDFKEAVKINTDVEIPKKGALQKDIVDKKALEALRTKYKIATRQFNRLIELICFFKLPDSVRPTVVIDTADSKAKKSTKAEDYEYTLWKLLAKTRIYAQNREVLSQLDPDERIAKLDETVFSVELEYASLQARFEARRALQAEEKLAGKKRKLVDGEDSPSGKKSKTEAA